MAQLPYSHSTIHLDGTTLEGGGQLLRLALSLSSLTKLPVHLSNIRGKRGSWSNPGDAGGLKPAHLAGAVWLAQATRSETIGMSVKSRDLVFKPSTDHQKGLRLADANDSTESRSGGQEWWDKDPNNDVWEDIYEDGILVRRESHIPMSTPGSIFLVLQAILPFILFSSSLTNRDGYKASILSDQAQAVPIRLKIEGGTNAFHSLSFEYASQVLFPMLSLKLGIDLISMKLHCRGWSMGRAAVGSVTFDIMPFKPGTVLNAFSFEERGSIVSFHVSILASTPSARRLIRDLVIERLSGLYPDSNIDFPVDEDSKHTKRLYLLIVAETSNGYRLGRDWLFDRKIKDDKINANVKELVGKVFVDLKHELAHGGCVDEYMQDQLVVFQALSRGESFVDAGQGKEGNSLHTQTARWVVEQILGIGFAKGGCKGIGFQAGQSNWKRAVSEDSIAAVEEDVRKLEI